MAIFVAMSFNYVIYFNSSGYTQQWTNTESFIVYIVHTSLL